MIWSWTDFGLSCLMGVAAAIVAIIATVAIERLGGVVGGIISTSPTTIIATALGIAYQTQSKAAVMNAMFSVPTGMFINILVLFVWRQAPTYTPERWPLAVKLLAVLSVSLSGWAVLASAVVFGLNMALHVSNVAMGAVAMGVTGAVGWLTVMLMSLPAPKGSRPVSAAMLCARGVMAGLAIFVSGMLARVDPVAAGFASSFPAIFTTAMVSMWVSQGTAVSSGAAGPMMVGSLSVDGYAVIFALLYTDRISFARTLLVAAISYASAIALFSVPSALVLHWVRGRQQHQQQQLQLPGQQQQEEEKEQELPLLLGASAQSYGDRKQYT
eukprot:TRINITY_DN3816_c1_g1_i1.p1 TRINITY_DN3816_c1_g1~~TRINITY_DN3816_c1_g1_i1.p1  ORF type:complete len:327 (-),score=52.70 TRINITY_DN3816_c1_g1_i1:5-985(-)